MRMDKPFDLDPYKEKTPNGVRYEWGLAGPDGAWFNLYPTDDQGGEMVKEAKHWLRRERDVVSIRTFRQQEDE